MMELKMMKNLLTSLSFKMKICIRRGANALCCIILRAKLNQACIEDYYPQAMRNA